MSCLLSTVYGGEDLREDLPFCKHVTTKVTADEFFNLTDTYLTEADLKWEDCVGICTDGVQAMAGNRGGLQALINSTTWVSSQQTEIQLR